jgi:hypothetical protein
MLFDYVNEGAMTPPQPLAAASLVGHGGIIDWQIQKEPA